MNNSSITSWTTTPSSFFEVKQPEYLKIAVYCVILVIALMANSLVIAVVYKNANRRMRTPNNYFVVNLAVADGLITIFNMGAQLLWLSNQSMWRMGYVAGTIFCKTSNFMWMFSISMSTGSLTAIAVDRFLLVFFPLRRIVTLRVARAVIVAIIIVVALISWPLLVFSAVFEFGDYKYCFFNFSSFEAFRLYFLSLFIMFIGLPLFVLLVLYTAIALRLWRRRSPGNQGNRERRNRRILLMLITIVVLFSLCWLPVTTLNFVCLAQPMLTSESCSILRNQDFAFTLWFVAYSNSALNPLVYFIFNEHFRYGARMIWCSIRVCCARLSDRHNQVGAIQEVNPTLQVGINSQASANEQEMRERQRDR